MPPFLHVQAEAVSALRRTESERDEARLRASGLEAELTAALDHIQTCETLLAGHEDQFARNEQEIASLTAQVCACYCQSEGMEYHCLTAECPCFAISFMACLGLPSNECQAVE